VRYQIFYITLHYKCETVSSPYKNDRFSSKAPTRTRKPSYCWQTVPPLRKHHAVSV